MSIYEQASVPDLIQMFANSIILYRKRPVKVIDITENREIIFTSLLSKKKSCLPIEDPLFDFTPVRLGMCNYNKNAFFIARKPARQYKQGLSPENLLIKSVTEANRDDHNALMTCDNRALSACILGKYPSLGEAIDHVKSKELKAMAFNRDWAITSELFVVYRATLVGLYSKEDNRVVLSDSYSFLKELLDVS